MEREIQLGDLVKNTNGNDIEGYVIAKYTQSNKVCLDIRTDDKIYYGTPMAYWKTVAPVESIE